MKLRNRIAYHFVSRLFLLLLCWAALLFICIITLSTFFNQKQTSTSVPITEIVDATNRQDGKITVDKPTLQSIAVHNLWLQILDEDGRELFSINKPPSMPEKYTPGLLVSNYVYPAKSGYHLSTWYESIGSQQLTWILGEKMKNNNPFFFWANNLWVLFMMVSGCLIAIYIGKSFGAPLLHVVSWIENLSSGVYQEPVNKRGPVNSRSKKGNLKSGYKTYKELMNALEDLMMILKKNKEDHEKLETTREEWMTGVSHDLKTPLSVLKGYTFLMASEAHQWETDQIRSFSLTMQKRIEYMEYLIEDFNLTFRLKNDTLLFKKHQINLVELLRETTISLTQLQEAENMEFEFLSDQENILIEGDENYLKRAFENLITNCIKHNPPMTNIKIRISKGDNFVKIEIEDDGVGMAEEVLDHLFDRYYRGTNSLNSTGTGLGMAISKQIILAHQGNIEIKSESKKGTKFIVKFATAPLNFCN
ncbi:sensor histidine kinase [Peribacillus frigoritolerans]|uniref:sensor histidine kinase n=1 Tax=Peribacillus castrilensis TaxID=2897690 RepID=UPI003DA64420